MDYVMNAAEIELTSSYLDPDRHTNCLSTDKPKDGFNQIIKIKENKENIYEKNKIITIERLMNQNKLNTKFISIDSQSSRISKLIAAKRLFMKNFNSENKNFVSRFKEKNDSILKQVKTITDKTKNLPRINKYSFEDDHDPLSSTYKFLSEMKISRDIQYAKSPDNFIDTNIKENAFATPARKTIKSLNKNKKNTFFSTELSSIMENKLQGSNLVNENKNSINHSTILNNLDSKNVRGKSNDHCIDKDINIQKQQLNSKKKKKSKTNSWLELPKIYIKEISGDNLPKRPNLLNDLNSVELEKLKKIQIFKRL